MKNKIRFFAVVVLLLVIPCLASCGNIAPDDGGETSVTTVPTGLGETGQTSAVSAETEPVTEAVTEPVTEAVTEAATESDPQSSEAYTEPTEADIAAELAEKYLGAVMDRVIWGKATDLGEFAVSGEAEEELREFTDSLVLQSIRELHLFGADISKLSIETEIGNFREEDGNLVGNAVIYQKLWRAEGEPLSLSKNLRLSFAFDGESCKLAGASRIAPELPTDIYLLGVRERTTFSELDIVYVNDPATQSEALACDLVASGIENIVLGSKNDLLELAGVGAEERAGLVSAFAAVSGGYLEESFSGTADVRISSEVESEGPGLAGILVRVDSGIVIERPELMCSPTPADGCFRVMTEQDESGAWRVTEMTVVHGDQSIAIHGLIQELYLESLAE